MNLGDARTYLGSSVLWADQSYDDAELDRAISAAGTMFAQETGCSRSTSNVSTSASTTTVNVTGTVSTFKSEDLIFARISNKRLRPTGFRTILRWIDGDDSDDEASPDYFAFDDDDVMWFRPVPDAVYTVSIRYKDQFTAIAADGSTSSGTTLSIPDRYIRPVLWWLAGPLLVYGEAASAYARPEWKMGVEYMTTVKEQVQRDQALGLGPTISE